MRNIKAKMTKITFLMVVLVFSPIFNPIYSWFPKGSCSYSCQLGNFIDHVAPINFGDLPIFFRSLRFPGLHSTKITPPTGGATSTKMLYKVDLITIAPFSGNTALMASFYQGFFQLNRLRVWIFIVIQKL